MAILTVYDNDGNPIPIPAIQGPPGTSGTDGQDGAPGADGITPTIGDNGNWYLGSTDTGKPSRGEQGIQGLPGQDGRDGSDAEVTAENIAAALGYTPADEDDLSGKLDKSGGTMTGDITMSPGNALNFTSNMAINLSTASILSAYGTPNTSEAIEKIGSQLFNLTIRGRQTRPDYTDVQNNTSSMALLSDVRNPKTTLPSVAEVNTQYYLGTQSAVSITMPTDAELGQEIKVFFKSGATAATLTCDLDNFDYTPKANTAVLITFRLVHKADEQVTGDEDEWTVEVKEG